MKKKQVLKNKEFILYVIFGITTSIINIGLFYILTTLGLVYTLSNIIALVIAKFFAYIFNKYLVFKRKCKSKKELIIEILSFIVCRFFTMIVDFCGLVFFVEVLNINKVLGKILITIIVVLINYFTNKKMVFKN